MGKMPLASLIGACSIGMLLTGCTGSRQNTNPAFAHGKADSGMGFTSHGQGTGQAGAPLADSSRGSPSLSPPANPTGTTTDPLAAGGSQLDSLSPYGGTGMGSRGAGTGSGAGMGGSNTGMNGGMPPMGPAPSPMPSPAPGATLGMSPTGSGISDKSLDPAGSPALTDPMAGSGRPSASGFQRASYSGNPGAGVRDAGFHATDMDASFASPAPKPSSASMLVPPTPPMPQTTTATQYPLPPGSSKATTKPTTSGSSSTATDTTSLAPMPPLPAPPPDMGMGDVSNPPPKIGAGSGASMPSMSTKPSTGAGGALMMPDYMQQKPGTN